MYQKSDTNSVLHNTLNITIYLAYAVQMLFWQRKWVESDINKVLANL